MDEVMRSRFLETQEGEDSFGGGDADHDTWQGFGKKYRHTCWAEASIIALDSSMTCWSGDTSKPLVV